MNVHQLTSLQGPGIILWACLVLLFTSCTQDHTRPGNWPIITGGHAASKDSVDGWCQSEFTRHEIIYAGEWLDTFEIPVGKPVDEQTQDGITYSSQDDWGHLEDLIHGHGPVDIGFDPEIRWLSLIRAWGDDKPQALCPYQLLFIWNKSDSLVYLGNNHELALELEAKDSAGAWTPAFPKPFAIYCGTGMSSYYLNPGRLAVVKVAAIPKSGPNLSQVRWRLGKDVSPEFEGRPLTLASSPTETPR